MGIVRVYGVMPAVILIDDKSRIESLMNDSMVAQ